MSDEIQPFNPASIMDSVKDKIKASFVGMIPEEQWDSMIKKVVDDYFYAKPKKDRWNNYKDKVKTPFENLCTQLLEQRAKELINEHLKTDEFQVTWDVEGKPILSEGIKKLLIENSGALLMNLLSAPLVNGLAMMQQDIQNTANGVNRY